MTVKGKGDYKGYEGETVFTITLKKTSLKSAAAAGSGQIKCTWTKDGQAEGYKIQYCTNKAFKNSAKEITVSGGTSQSALIEKLTAGKKYYVRIRSYRKVGSRNWYSEWSSARTVTVR